MAKLTRQSAGGTPSYSMPRNNPTLLIGVVLAVAVGILFWVLLSQIQAKENVMVAKGNIPAFSTIGPDQLQAQSVPKKSIEAQDLTEAKFTKLTQGGQRLVNRIEILPGQRVVLGAVTPSSTGSLAAVRKGERVIAVSSTFPGAVGGVATAGSVVDVLPASSGGGDTSQGGAIEAVQNAKVLALGAGSGAAENVRPDGAKLKTSENQGSIIVVLALPAAEANKVLAMPQVALALDPALGFTEKGVLCPIAKCSKGGGIVGSTNPGEGGTPDGAEAPAVPSDSGQATEGP